MEQSCDLGCQPFPVLTVQLGPADLIVCLPCCLHGLSSAQYAHVLSAEATFQMRMTRLGSVSLDWGLDP